MGSVYLCVTWVTVGFASGRAHCCTVQCSACLRRNVLIVFVCRSRVLYLSGGEYWQVVGLDMRYASDPFSPLPFFSSSWGV